MDAARFVQVAVRIPRFATSTFAAATTRAYPVLDGRDVTMPNRWRLPPHTVAIVGRPAVWSVLDIATPRIPLFFGAIAARRYHLELDFGGHLFIVVTSADGASADVIEAGPERSNGSGALLPYSYPEDDFIAGGVFDFDPLVIDAPHGFSAAFFADLVRSAHRDYDGDQRYTAVEIPFLRVGRDSNSYAVGVLVSCGVDPRALPHPKETMRWEWTGYPGMEDPVHRANFGAYLGRANALGAGIDAVAYHNADGSVRYAVVGGTPGAAVRLPGGDDVRLDGLGRIVFAPADALRAGIPIAPTQPPDQIASVADTPRTRHPPAPKSPSLSTANRCGWHRDTRIPGRSWRATTPWRSPTCARPTNRMSCCRSPNSAWKCAIPNASIACCTSGTSSRSACTGTAIRA